mgnify:CR=1 FL=1
MNNHNSEVTCPHCGREYDVHLDWTICPYCGFDRDKGKYRIVGSVGQDEPFTVQEQKDDQWQQVAVFEAGEIGFEQAKEYIRQMTSKQD